MYPRRDLPGIQLIGRQPRRQQLGGPLLRGVGWQSQSISTRHEARTAEDRRTPRGIEHAKLLAIHCERAFERREPDECGHRELVEFLLGPTLERTEVLLGILVDGERCEKRREEIARREPESPAAVGTVDLHEIVSAHG